MLPAALPASAPSKNHGSAYTERVATEEPRSNSGLATLVGAIGLVVAACVGPLAWAQESAEPCPCFSYEEVEGVFRSGQKLIASGGGGSCQASDYAVEFKGEVVVTDQNFKTVARASVAWADFDPGRCEYRDASVEPEVERSIHWPHPAPEVAARACLDIISSVIKNLDTTGNCRTYP